MLGAEDKKKYILAVVPQMPAVETYERWTPFTEKLSEELGVQIQLRTYPSIRQFEADIVKGVPDFAFMNPYLMAKSGNNYIPLVKDKTDLMGIVIVRKNGGISSVKDLENKEIAFPDPNAFAASLYVRALLTEKEKIHFKPVYVKTHSNVYRATALNKTAAGGGVNNTLMREPDELRNDLKVIYRTPGTAPHPLAAHRRVPKNLRQQVIQTIFKFAEDNANDAMFNKIQIPKPVAAHFESDYQPLQELKLETYAVQEAE